MLVDDRAASVACGDILELLAVLQDYPDRKVAALADEIQLCVFDIMKSYQPSGRFV